MTYDKERDFEELSEFFSSAHPEQTMCAQLAARIADRRSASSAEPIALRDGDPLTLFLAGYSGGANVGSDVRVAEMIRQFRTIFGAENLAFRLMALGARKTLDAFPDVEIVPLEGYPPSFLAQNVARSHGVIACEGSMFKSTFADIFTAIMGGALGLALAEKKLAVGYGAEIGTMQPDLERFVKEQAAGALVLARSEGSRRRAEQLGLRVEPGADTAWTFDPAPPERAASLLREAGWDGVQPVLTVCPINPFVWPLRVDFEKARALKRTGAHKDAHYGWVIFHTDTEEGREKNRRYLKSLADGVSAFAKERGAFVVLVAMERVDARACDELNTLLPAPAPIFASGVRDIHDQVALLRRSTYLVTSRYHAMVTSMPALVPSVGVSFDERIVNLLDEQGQTHRAIGVSDPELSSKLVEQLRRLDREREEVQTRTAIAVVDQLQRMGRMGATFANEVSRVYPHVPRIHGAGGPADWARFLPPLSSPLKALLERHG